MNRDEIRDGLNKLQPSIPWAHHFDLGHGIVTVTPDAENFYRKAVRLNALAELLPSILRLAMQRDSFEGLRCLDLGSAEGAHSIFMAEAGAAEGLGLEGRHLYVDRATFVARVKGVTNVAFRQADIRTLDMATIGSYDLVLCSGILHHLDKDAFLKTTQLLHDLTGDSLILFTHVSSEWVSDKFRLQPTDPIAGKYHGSLFREHKAESTQAERLAKVRASLDNEHFFWAREESLVERFVDVGFKTIIKVYEPAFVLTHMERVYRGIWVLRRKTP